MTLEFEKVIPQVQKMGRAIAARTQEISERGQTALEMLASAGNLDEIWRKIKLARKNDAGYRGAAPFDEEINQPYLFNRETIPERATILAVDGSQVYPDRHGVAVYYLTNIGVYVYHHGTDDLPEQFSEPQLFYNDSDLRDGYGQIISNTVVNARRLVQEIHALARECWQRRQSTIPLIGLMDGPLLHVFGQEDAERLQNDYFAAMVHLHDTHVALMKNKNPVPACLVGYVDRHDSRFVVRLLELLQLPDESVKRAILQKPGDFEGLTDGWLFSQILRPGERSAVMVQQSPKNLEYHRKGANYEICFFYLNVGHPEKPQIARIEIPVWVARLEHAVDIVQGILLEQCLVAGSYPYALTRADEIAVVRGHDKFQLVELITTELIRQQQEQGISSKQAGKDAARGDRQPYRPPVFKTVDRYPKR